MAPKVLETLYYILGFMLNSMRKLSLRMSEQISDSFRYLHNKCKIIQVIAKNNVDLPREKVDCIIAFGGLTYPSADFFEFSLRIENVFVSCLSEQNLVIYGPRLIDKIRMNLIENKLVLTAFSKFLPGSITNELLQDVSRCFFTVYSRMKGKDFSYKLLKARSSMKVTTRNKQAVLADPDNYRAIRKKAKKIKYEDEEEIKEHREFSTVLNNVVDSIVNANN